MNTLLMVLAIALGCVVLYQWLRRHQGLDDRSEIMRKSNIESSEVFHRLDLSHDLVVKRADNSLPESLIERLPLGVAEFFNRYELLQDPNGATQISRSSLLKNDSYEEPFIIGTQDYYDIYVMGRSGSIKFSGNEGADLDQAGAYENIWSMIDSEFLGS